MNDKQRKSWREIVHLLQIGNVSQLNIAGRDRTDAIMAVDEQLVNAEKLACLVLAYANSLNDILPVARAEIIGLARGICPDKVKAPGVYVDNGDGVNVHWKPDA